MRLLPISTAADHCRRFSLCGQCKILRAVRERKNRPDFTSGRFQYGGVGSQRDLDHCFLYRPYGLPRPYPRWQGHRVIAAAVALAMTFSDVCEASSTQTSFIV